MISYFGSDGNYGDAVGIVVVDTSTWTEDDWDAIESAPDYRRAVTALSIAKTHDRTD